MKRTLTTTFILIVSSLFLGDIYAQKQIPQDGDHFTMVDVNQQYLGDSDYQNKKSTLDIIIEKLQGQTPLIEYRWYMDGPGNQITRWTTYPNSFGLYNWANKKSIPAKPGKYIWAFGYPISNFGEVDVTYKSDPVITSSTINGFFSDINITGGDFVINTDKTANIELDSWFDGSDGLKGKNNLYKDNVLMARNQTNYSLTAGKYKLEIFDRQTSDVKVQIIEFEVKTGPSIETQPVNQSLIEGQTLNLSVEASGGDLAYQWYKDGSIISGATEALYSVSNATVDETGKYKCEVKNPIGSAFSNEVSVSVTYRKPEITTQPIAQTLNESENLSLTVVADGKGLSYQWQKDGINISGSTSATYYKPNIDISDAGEYQCLVTNSGGTVKSSLIKVAISINIPTITTNPKSQELVENASFTLSIEASGSNLTYQWKKDNNIISGATNSTFSKSNIGVEDQGVYSCTVSNQAGTVTSSNATIAIKNAVPVITVQPQSQDLTLGSTLNLSVDAIGNDLSYQWKKDGIPIASATSSSYSKANISANEDGAYVCTITNSGGLVTSDIATIKIVAIVGIPTFDGLKEEYVVGDSPITLKITGTSADIFKNFKVNGVSSIQFNPDKAGLYEVEASTEDGKVSLSTYVIVK